ncbi:MAG: hypothetical protein A2001_17890, partial [Treponema sp. GWC1_61_84]
SGILESVIDDFNRVQATILESIDDFNAITYEPCDRICYTGTDNYLEGEKCGEIMAHLTGGKGEVAILLNSFDKVNHRLRQKGFTNYLTRKHPAVKVVEVLETQQIPENTYKKTLELLDKWPKLSGIYVDEASTPHMAVRAVKERRRMEAVKLVAHDVTELTVASIRAGELTTLSQNPFSQGYEPLVNVYNYLILRERPIIDRLLPKTDDLEIIDSRTIAQFWNEGEGRILTEKARRSLTEPLGNRTGETYRISVILPNDSGFFKQVENGMKAAAERLRKENATVTIVLPEELKRGDNSAATTRRYIEKEVAAGAHAVVTPIFEKELVGYVNELLASGIPVATYNSEPIGLRAMLDTVFRNSDFILQASQTLAANSVESMEATRQISATMEKIVAGTSAQVEKLASTGKVVADLLGNVDQTTLKFDRIMSTADETNKLAGIGQSKVSSTSASLTEIQAGYAQTAKMLDSLNLNSRKVQETVALMEDLATQTNLIAINVSILAARAGANGSGFAVVASDIRKLAERSASGAVDIAALIKATLRDISEVTGIIRKDETDIDSIAESAGLAELSLNDIIAISTENRNTVHAIMAGIEAMKELSMQVRGSMEELSRFNLANSQAIEEISSNSMEMSRQVGDNAKVSQMLCDMARSQKVVLSQFTI